MENWKVEETEEEIIVRIPKKNDYTIKELKQKLINYLVEHLNDNKLLYDSDIEVIKVLFGTNKIMLDSGKIKENLF